MDNPLKAIKKKEILGIAHRQWMRANHVKERYEIALQNTDEKTAKDMQLFYLSEVGTFMFTWYSFLFSVLEYLQDNEVDLTNLDEDYNKLYNALRRSRNSILHAEKEYWDNRQSNLLALPNAGVRIRALHSSLGSYFLDAMKEY